VKEGSLISTAPFFRRKTDMVVQTVSLSTPLGQLTVAATVEGVCRVTFEGAGEGNGLPGGEVNEEESGRKHCTRHPADLRGLTSPSDEERMLGAAAAELQGYFDGTVRRFTLPLAISGTPFQRSAWSMLLTIPYGETRSYGWLADRMGIKGGARAAGGACGANPVPIIIPCHRIVASDGSLGGYSGGAKGEGMSLKRRLLELEGALR